jgi:hypothetical protein
MPTETDTFASEGFSEGLGEPYTGAVQELAVVTTMSVSASPRRTWQSLVFYEEVKERPPWFLRLLLPVPVRTQGEKSRVGGEAICLYESGHLLKRTTHIVENELYQFEVVEQQLPVGGSMRLHGGWYRLRELADGRTELAVQTRYVSSKRPRWLWRPLERFVCHLFHRFLLRSVQRKAERS